MRKFIVNTLILSFLFPATSFAGIQAKCTGLKGKTRPCTLENQTGNLVITYKDKKNSVLNKNIPGDRITRLSGGEYARRRVAESVAGAILLTPVALFILFSKKKIDNYGIEYLDENQKPASFLIQIKKKYSMNVQSMLQSISGKEVVFQETKKKK